MQVISLHFRNNSVSPINQLLATLRFFATGTHLLSIGDYIQADKATICRIVNRTARLIASLANEYIHMPRNELEIAEAQNKFYEVNGFPSVIGAIDGTHIRIQSPGKKYICCWLKCQARFKFYIMLLLTYYAYDKICCEI